MKNIIVVSSLTILLLFILPIILIAGVRYVPDRYQPSLDKTFDLYGQISISQSFTATADNLAVIGLSIKNPNLQNKKDITLTIVDNNNILGSSTLNGAAIPDGDFVKFKFPPITGSKDRNLTFVLSSPGSNRNDALKIFLTKQKLTGVDGLKKLPLTVDSTDLASTSASFVPFYRVNSSFLIKNTFLDFLNRFFADQIFAIFYILLIVMMLIILLARFPLPNWKK